MHDNPKSSDEKRGRVLVTGATGRVGGPVLKALFARGYTVRAVSSRQQHSENPLVEWITMNWLTNVDFSKALDGCIGVIHLGAELSDISKMQQVNVGATEALAAAAEKSTNIGSFVYASTISVYGTPTVPVVSEDTPTITADHDIPTEYWAEPYIRHYARTKLLAERVLRKILEKTPCVVLRPTVIVDDHKIRKIAEWSKLRRLLQSYRRSHFIHVDDVAGAFVWALEQGLENRGPIFDVFNLSDDDLNGSDFCSMFKRAAILSGKQKYRQFLVAPGVFDRLRLRLKFRAYSHGFPLGTCQFAGAKLCAAGYQFKLGMRAAETQAFQESQP
jgi:nucleoside-diphosphate-sugar epimerase